MRREGMSYKLVNHRLLSKKLMVKKCEPIEELTIDLPESPGRAVEFVTMRKGEMLAWKLKERMIVKFNIPSRGIIGLQSITCNSW
jgi:GTP-binding protein